MLLLFLKGKDKKETRANIQISASSFLNKTNITLKQETTRCNNRNDLLRLGFVLKISLFSGASLKPIRSSMMVFFAKVISCN